MKNLPAMISDILEPSPLTSLSDFFDRTMLGGARSLRETFDSTETTLIVNIALPGFEVNEIHIRSESDNTLIIKAHTNVEGAKSWMADYERRMVLPRGMDTDKATATFKSGLLRIDIPRSERLEGKEITILQEDSNINKAVHVDSLLKKTATA